MSLKYYRLLKKYETMNDKAQYQKSKIENIKNILFLIQKIIYFKNPFLNNKTKMKGGVNNDEETTNNEEETTNNEEETTNNEEETTNNEEETNNEELDNIILKKIRLVKDEFLKKNLIYRLMNKDGLIINNFIYSKKTGNKMICAHWDKLQQIENENDHDRKRHIVNDLIEIYTIDDNGFSYCKICGNKIYDVDHSLFSAYGYIPSDDIVEDFQNKIKFNFARLNEVDVNCATDDFFRLLKEKGQIEFNEKQIKRAKMSCDMLRNILKNIGLLIKMNDMLDIILDSLDLISSSRIINTYDMFKDKILSKYPDRKDIRPQYEHHVNFGIACIIGIRLLIAIQTKTPSYVFSQTKKCDFKSFNGDDGIKYMSCVLGKMNIGFPKKMNLCKEIIY